MRHILAQFPLPDAHHMTPLQCQMSLSHTQTTTGAILAPEGGLTQLRLIQHSIAPNHWHLRKGYNNIGIYSHNEDTTAPHQLHLHKRVPTEKLAPLLLLTAPVVVCV